MKPSDFQKTIQCQFDCKLKRVVKGIVRNYRKELKRRRNKEISYCELPEIVVEKLAVWDEYESDYFRFQVSGFDVLVKNELLAEALNALPERKRDIILLRDNSVRRRIKAYRTFASLDRALNVGASKRKFGSRVKLNALSG